MKRLSRLGLLTAASAVGLALVVPMGTANADVSALAGDVTGVGSDTAQYALDFLGDGTITGGAGFNSTNAGHRIFNFDASGDANGTLTAGATSVLRAGTKPVTRPNGSGGGITALNNDNGATKAINYVRSSRLPTAAEQATASANGTGGLHVIQFATDSLQIAKAATTNAPSVLSVVDLYHIYNGDYTTWSQVPGYSGPAPTATIVPTIPQAGSGTRNFFLADLTQAGVDNGLPAFTLRADVTVVQEHDPRGIVPTTGTDQPNRIGPFSSGRVSLLNGGYFGASLQNLVTLNTTGASYNVSRGLYILIRENDVNSTAPFLTGGTLNWSKTLFVGNTSFIARATSRPLLQAAGVTPAYQDLGIISG